MLALQNAVIPDRSVTVFAGVDRDAVNRAREYMTATRRRRPRMGLFKDGKQVFMLQRTDLQQMNDTQVAEALTKAFDEHCAKAGPSVVPEKFKEIQPYRGCGSQIPVVGRAVLVFAGPHSRAARRPVMIPADRPKSIDTFAP